MAAVTFGVLSVAACAFLVYVLAHFHRELARLNRSDGESKLIYVGSYQTDRALVQAKSSASADKRQPAKIEAVMRKEVLISGIVGLVCLLAPFIFVVLLSSTSTWRH
jgi:hypothetical protein